MADIDPDTLPLAAQRIAAKRLTEFYNEVADTITCRYTGDGSDTRGARSKSGASYLNSSLPAESRIPLDLVRWRVFLETPATTSDDQREKINYILDFFLKIVQKNGMDGTAALKTLQKALTALGEEGEFPGNAKGSWNHRIAQRSLSEIEQDLQALDPPDRRLSSPSHEALTSPSQRASTHLQVGGPVRSLYSPRAIYRAIPLFNVWDAVSFIYTICVEEIKDQLKAELHLFQFRLIVRILRSCKYFAIYAGLTTVAAAWTTEVPHLVAFATTCVGPRRCADATKKDMAKARCKFISTITAHLKEELTFVAIDCPNRPGNWVTHPVLKSTHGASFARIRGHFCLCASAPMKRTVMGKAFSYVPIARELHISQESRV